MITYEQYERWRDERGMKNADVAKKAQIPPSTFTDWKHGKSVPKTEKLAKIANALEIPYSEFVMDEFEFVFSKDGNKIAAVRKLEDGEDQLLVKYKGQTYSTTHRFYEYYTRVVGKKIYRDLIDAADGCTVKQIQSVIDLLNSFKRKE